MMTYGESLQTPAWPDDKVNIAGGGRAQLGASR